MTDYNYLFSILTWLEWQLTTKRQPGLQLPETETLYCILGFWYIYRYQEI